MRLEFPLMAFAQLIISLRLRASTFRAPAIAGLGYRRVIQDMLLRSVLQLILGYRQILPVHFVYPTSSK